MLGLARQFFNERKVLEVDCPLTAQAACIDLHIDLMQVTSKHYPLRFLPSSPEYFMKRLLADGIGDIYQLAHVFRDEECSPRHNPEFMMAEWYRIGFSFEQMIQDTLDFIELFLGKKQVTFLSYRDALKKYAGIDYVHASTSELLDCLEVIPYDGIEDEGRNALLNLILGTLVEPAFKEHEIVVLQYFPQEQAALAKKIQLGDESAALRFEIYYQGVELANGYHELIDAKEQKERLIQANAQRAAYNKEILPIDHAFLHALERGLPDCCGVAVGFDRLMMLRHGLDSLTPILPFVWNNA